MGADEVVGLPVLAPRLRRASAVGEEVHVAHAVVVAHPLAGGVDDLHEESVANEGGGRGETEEMVALRSAILEKQPCTKVF